MFKSDLIFYPLLWITITSPLIWFLLFLLVRRRKRSKVMFQVSFSFYLIAAVYIAFKMSGQSSMAIIGCMERGVPILGMVTLVSTAAVTGARFLLPRK